MVVRFRHPDGRTLWLEHVVAPVTDASGRVVAVEGLAVVGDRVVVGHLLLEELVEEERSTRLRGVQRRSPLQRLWRRFRCCSRLRL